MVHICQRMVRKILLLIKHIALPRTLENSRGLKRPGRMDPAPDIRPNDDRVGRNGNTREACSTHYSDVRAAANVRTAAAAFAADAIAVLVDAAGTAVLLLLLPR